MPWLIRPVAQRPGRRELDKLGMTGALYSREAAVGLVARADEVFTTESRLPAKEL